MNPNIVRALSLKPPLRAACPASLAGLSFFVFATLAVATLVLSQVIMPTASKAASSATIESKIDSQLLQALRTPAGESSPSRDVVSGVRADANGRILVDIKATVTDSVLEQIRALGGSIVSTFPQYQSIRASVPLGHLTEVAAIPQVSFIRAAEVPSLNRGSQP